MKQSLFPCLALLTLIAAGCSNPADDVAEAQVANVSKPAPAIQNEGEIYQIAPESTISFIGSKVTGSHDGGFEKFSGQFVLADGTPEGSHGNVEIDTNSIWSDNDKLTGHLKSADFFDVAQFPTSSFTATKIENTGTGYQVTGNLELHGITKSISFPADIQLEGDKINLKAEFFIRRFDFEMEYPGKADNLIRDEVVIQLDIKAVKAAV